MAEQKEAKIYAVCDKNGKLTRLVEAQKVAQVKAHLLGGVTITEASALTVARAGIEVEKAQGGE